MNTKTVTLFYVSVNFDLCPRKYFLSAFKLPRTLDKKETLKTCIKRNYIVIIFVCVIRNKIGEKKINNKKKIFTSS